MKAASPELLEFFPSSLTVSGNACLIFLYGIIISRGAKYLADGAEELSKRFNSAVFIGGVLMPLLGAVPDAAITFHAMMDEDAESQIEAAVGMMLGSSFLLLFIVWLGALWLGKCDVTEGPLPDTVFVVNRQDTSTLKRPAELALRSGVEFNYGLHRKAIIMGITSLLYLVIIIPGLATLNHHGRHHNHDAIRWASVIVGCACLLGFVVVGVNDAISILLQVPDESSGPEATRRESNLSLGVDRCIPISSAHGNGEADAEVSFVTPELSRPLAPQPDLRTLSPLSPAYQPVGNGVNDHAGTGLQQPPARTIGQRRTTQGRQWFIHAVLPVEEVASHARILDGAARGRTYDTLHWTTVRRIFTSCSGVWQIVLGSVMVCLFCDPICDALVALTDKTNDSRGGSHLPISTLAVSFVVLPLVCSLGETFSTLLLASRKDKKTTTIAFGQLYGTAITNNTLCLGILLVALFVRDIKWRFNAEAIALFLLQVVSAAISCRRKVIRVGVEGLGLCIWGLFCMAVGVGMRYIF